ncbi:MAG: DUF4337 family protein, partial [Gemmatimonadota bacterium]
MDIDPMESVGTPDDAASKAAGRLNTWVALTVALLATFTGICSVKDNNIGQAMQQAQADKIDHWSFYQARNIREEIAKSTLTELRLSSPRPGAGSQLAQDSAIQRYAALAAEQSVKKDSLRVQAAQDQTDYDALNYRDDQ